MLSMGKPFNRVGWGVSTIQNQSVRSGGFFPLPVVQHHAQPIDEPCLEPAAILVRQLLIVGNELLVGKFPALYPADVRPRLKLCRHTFQIQSGIQREAGQAGDSMVCLSF